MPADGEPGRSRTIAVADHGKRAALSRGLPRLIRWAEKDRSLPEVLHMVGAMFETTAQSYSAFAGTVLNVACVLMVFLMIMVIPGLFMPLISLISRLSG